MRHAIDTAAVALHKATAKRLSTPEWDGTMARLCSVPDNTLPRGLGAASAPPPARANWHAEPYKVFDNLHWVGTKIHSAWALKTSDGIILIDTLYPRPRSSVD